MTTDPAGGWPLRGDFASTPPSLPGETVRVEAELQTAAPMAFTGLRVGPDHRLWVLGPSGSVRGRPGEWRIDEVMIDEITIDEAVVDYVDALEAGTVIVVHGNFGVGARVAIRATNVGDVPAYFYATWELEDVQ
jgi:hypothetical protein